MNLYTGKPFNITQYNCWHHVSAVRDSVGLDTPKFEIESINDVNATIEKAIKDGYFIETKTPIEMDLVFMFDRCHHIGIIVGGRVSHCSAVDRAAVVDTLPRMHKRFRKIKYYMVSSCQG